MVRKCSNRRLPTGRLLAVLSVVTLIPGLSGCAFVLETVLGVAAEEVADGDRSPRDGVQPPVDDDTTMPSGLRPAGHRNGKPVGSVYVAGPVPGWEREPVVFGSGSRSPFFAASLYRGQCRSLINLSFQGGDLFGPVARPPVDPFDMGNNLGISPDYVPFGRVMLGGTGPQHYQWEPMMMLSGSGAGCDFLWFRLISFGKDEGVETIHR